MNVKGGKRQHSMTRSDCKDEKSAGVLGREQLLVIIPNLLFCNRRYRSATYGSTLINLINPRSRQMLFSVII